MKKRFPYLFLAVSLLLALAARLSTNWALQNPAWIESWYSRRIYPVWASVVGFFGKLVPFSLAEWWVLFALVGALAFVVWMIVLLIHKHAAKALRTAAVLLGVASLLFVQFQWGWALNYYRQPYAVIAGLDASAVSPEELEAVYARLIEKINLVRPLMQEDSQGVTVIPYPLTQVAQKAREHFAASGLEWLSGDYSTPKPLLFSRVLTYGKIVGIFFPMTYEANLNTEDADCFFAANALHEIAHQHGFAREDEANYLAFYLADTSSDVYFQYSGTLLALQYVGNALYSASPEAYSRHHATIDAGVHRDSAASAAFWQQYDTPIAEISTESNNKYLQSQHQSDGVKSYGRMVDLIVAQWRAGTL